MAIDLNKEGLTGGALIKYLRTNSFNMNQEEFAEAMNVNISTLRNWEQGLSEPPAYFMAYLKSEDEHLRSDYDTPISAARRTFAAECNNNDRRRKMANHAIDLMKSDSKQDRVAGLLKEMLKKDGIIENLQKVSPYFDKYTTTDVAAAAQVVLLGEISSKLDIIINKLEDKG